MNPPSSASKTVVFSHCRGRRAGHLAHRLPEVRGPPGRRPLAPGQPADGLEDGESRPTEIMFRTEIMGFHGLSTCSFTRVTGDVELTKNSGDLAKKVWNLR